jgi:hypothetical protein
MSRVTDTHDSPQHPLKDHQSPTSPQTSGLTETRKNEAELLHVGIYLQPATPTTNPTPTIYTRSTDNAAVSHPARPASK